MIRFKKLTNNKKIVYGFFGSKGGVSKGIYKSLISYKDVSNEILNIIKSKKDEFIFKLDLSTKEELEVVKKRLEILEKKLNKKNKSKNVKKVKKP